MRHSPQKVCAVAVELTPREREVLQLLAEGRTTKRIASKLNVSVKTVETHRRQIMDKAGYSFCGGTDKILPFERG